MFDLQDVEPKGIKKLCLVKQSWYVCQILQYCVAPDLHNISACQIFTIFGCVGICPENVCGGAFFSQAPFKNCPWHDDTNVQHWVGEIVNYGFWGKWIMTRTNLSSDNWRHFWLFWKLLSPIVITKTFSARIFCFISTAEVCSKISNAIPSHE